MIVLYMMTYVKGLTKLGPDGPGDHDVPERPNALAAPAVQP
jgi:hypothetical protein